MIRPWLVVVRSSFVLEEKERARSRPGRRCTFVRRPVWPNLNEFVLRFDLRSSSSSSAGSCLIEWVLKVEGRPPVWGGVEDTLVNGI